VTPLPFARPLARVGFALAGSVSAIAVVAGTVRVLPLFFAANVPAGVLPALLRGVVAMALEVGLFVAPPIAAAVVFARAVERGEVGALAALGVRPARLVASASVGWLALALAGALAAMFWGSEAAAPGRMIARLMDDARAACVSAEAPAAIEVPLADAAWLCFPNEPPRAVLRAPFANDRGGRAVLTATDLRPSDDLRSLRAKDALLVVEGEEGRASLGADAATIRGVVPLGRASNLGAATRAIVLAPTSLLLAIATALAIVRARIASRARAVAIGVATSIGALLAFSSLERAPMPFFAYVAVPLAGAVLLGLATWTLARR
jgi:hypothetical protein